jgi:hypothetical protein
MSEVITASFWAADMRRRASVSIFHRLDLEAFRAGSNEIAAGPLHPFLSVVGTAEQLLNLTEAEASLVEMKLAWADGLRDLRLKRSLTQTEVAKSSEDIVNSSGYPGDSVDEAQLRCLSRLPFPSRDHQSRCLGISQPPMELPRRRRTPGKTRNRGFLPVRPSRLTLCQSSLSTPAGSRAAARRAGR